MTNTTSLLPVRISSSDWIYLEALVVAFESALDSDMAFRHDPARCDRTGECVCPDLPNPVMETINSALSAALEAVVGDRFAVEVGGQVARGHDLDQAFLRAGLLRVR